MARACDAAKLCETEQSLAVPPVADEQSVRIAPADGAATNTRPGVLHEVEAIGLARALAGTLIHDGMARDLVRQIVAALLSLSWGVRRPSADAAAMIILRAVPGAGGPDIRAEKPVAEEE